MIRDLINETRQLVIADSRLSPTREITFTRTSDDESFVLNSFVGAGQFNKEEKESLKNMQSFGGLILESQPKVNDTVLYDGELYSVTRSTKLGQIYTVYCEQSRHKGARR